RPTPRPRAPAAVPAPRAAARAPLRWERRRVTLLRAGVEFVGEGDEVLDAGRTLETLVEKVAGFGGRLEGLSPSGLLASFGRGRARPGSGDRRRGRRRHRQVAAPARVPPRDRGAAGRVPRGLLRLLRQRRPLWSDDRAGPRGGAREGDGPARRRRGEDQAQPRL